MPDSFDQLKAEFAADPAGAEALQRVIDKEAENFLRLAVRFAMRWSLDKEDPWLAKRVLNDAMIWLQEAHRGLDKEEAARRKPGTTAGSFRR